jgi:predicted alpha/beta-hydrolase family hydrolase
MLAAEDTEAADALILLAYPLSPPAHPDRLRTEHFPGLRTPTLFVHGTRDPFGSAEALDRARSLIPARTSLLVVEGAGHDLHHSRRPGARGAAVVERIAAGVLGFLGIEQSN